MVTRGRYRIRKMKAEGKTMTEIARLVGVTRQAFFNLNGRTGGWHNRN